MTVVVDKKIVNKTIKILIHLNLIMFDLLKFSPDIRHNYYTLYKIIINIKKIKNTGYSLIRKNTY